MALGLLQLENSFVGFMHMASFILRKSRYFRSNFWKTCAFKPFMDGKHFRVPTLFNLRTSQKIHKTIEFFFSPQHANELNIPNILKYASNRINSFIYPNKLYYILESIMPYHYIVETFSKIHLSKIGL